MHTKMTQAYTLEPFFWFHHPCAGQRHVHIYKCTGTYTHKIDQT